MIVIGYQGIGKSTLSLSKTGTEIPFPCIEIDGMDYCLGDLLRAIH